MAEIDFTVKKTAAGPSPGSAAGGHGVALHRPTATGSRAVTAYGPAEQ